MVSIDKVSEAMPTSFISLRWCSSSFITHIRENGWSVSDRPRGRRTSTTSPAQSCDNRSLSTAMASWPVERGSRIQTMLRAGSEPTSTPAEPSLNSITTGEICPALPISISRINCAQASRLALAINPWSRSHFTSEAGEGTSSLASI